MLQSVVITNARLKNYPGLQQIIIDSQGCINRIMPQNSQPFCSTSEQVIDVQGDWISQGGVDLQINGALGLAFSELEDSHFLLLQQIGELLWHQGVDAFTPTIVTTSIAKIRRSLSVIRHYLEQYNPTEKVAKILGVHLEGPFLNYQKRGAHSAQFLLPLTLENLKRVLGEDGDLIKIITLAPELDPTNSLIPYLTDLGITVSLGHSQATEAQANQAFKLGARMVTHAFNAMPSLHHRQPGLLAAAICHPQVYCGLIADGQHVAPSMIDILLRASNYEQGVFLVSDALAPLGLPSGLYSWDDRQIEVQGGTAKLLDGTLSGTTLPLLVGTKNLVQWQLCSPETAIALATNAPRQALNLANLAIREPAHLLRWQWEKDNTSLTWQRLT
ncbi:MAG: N-acetylglucosamine-6-phosphate deacetylase [Snowella sp.]|nr:N-acetylglucosamine-6-phosphate deacetylase [Snowella sp.]